MSWSQQTKIQQQQADDEILTPDGQQILVGAAENEVLVYGQGFNNWGTSSKTAGSWSLPTKIL